MRVNLLCAFLVSALPAVSAASSASAQQNISQYTSIAASNCSKIDSVKAARDEIGVTYACRGLPGHVVLVSEDDLRATVSIGSNRKNAREQKAFEQGFSPFNSVNDKLEWRIDAKTKKPFATIHRWQITDQQDVDKDGRPKSVGLLVVTRIPPGKSCHVAYIDVRANENPNALAQKAADELARNFDCDKDSVRIVGNKARAAELSGAD